MQSCNQCKKLKSLDYFIKVNNKFNRDVIMQVCKECVDNNKFKYIKRNQAK